MHSFEVHSKESACRKSGRLGLEKVQHDDADNKNSTLVTIIKKTSKGTLLTWLWTNIKVKRKK